MLWLSVLQYQIPVHVAATGTNTGTYITVFAIFLHGMVPGTGSMLLQYIVAHQLPVAPSFYLGTMMVYHFWRLVMSHMR